MFGGATKTASYRAYSLVKGDPEWKAIAAKGWQDGWPVYSQTGITMNSKIYFFGKFMLIHICKGVFPSFINRWLECCPVF